MDLEGGDFGRPAVEGGEEDRGDVIDLEPVGDADGDGERVPELV
jgi:hypothetical protein